MGPGRLHIATSLFRPPSSYDRAVNAPWTLEWWSQVWVPLALGVATLSVGVVSLRLARAAHALAERAAQREDAARIRADKVLLIGDISAWMGRQFPMDSENRSELATATVHDHLALVARLQASEVPLAHEIAERMRELVIRAGEARLKDVTDLLHRRKVHVAATTVAGRLLADWSRGSLTPVSASEQFDLFLAEHLTDNA